MKIMFLNKAHIARVHLDSNPCAPCMYYFTNCSHIPPRMCVQYGGFQDTNKEIFEI